MVQEEKEFRQVAIFCALGVFVIVAVLFAPHGQNETGFAFFKSCQACTWQQLYDWPAAWSSLKIILLCTGLFLIIDAFGTLLALIRLKSLALSVFFLHVLPCLGMVYGAYYLLKALL